MSPCVGVGLPARVGQMTTTSIPAAPAAKSVAERLGHPRDARLLVLHADDLGMAHSVNEATFEALEQGFVTSASVMVPCPWFPEVAARARQRTDLDLGVHLTVNSEWPGYRWGPVSSRGVPTLLDADGYFPLVPDLVARRASLADLETELRAQIERALSAEIAVTHLDSHMGTLFLSPEVLALYRRLGRAYRLPVLVTDSFGGDSVAIPDDDGTLLIDRVLAILPGPTQAQWRSTYEGMLAPLPSGVHELILHLGHDGDELRAATGNVSEWGSAWRQQDLDLVRDPEFRRFLEREGFVLVTWRDLRRALPLPFRDGP
jgi:chitin disaccharide deacetylase